MRLGRLLGLGFASLLLTAAAAPVSANLINGDFATGDFTGWTVQGHVANPPTNPAPGALPTPSPGVPYYGAQVLTPDDIAVPIPNPPYWQYGTLVPPRGSHYAMISSLPSADWVYYYDPTCPTTVAADSGQDADGDGNNEVDVTSISQKFVANVPCMLLEFTWSYLRGENTRAPYWVDGVLYYWLHDDFPV